MGLVGLGLSKPIRDPTHPEDPIETDPKPADPTILTVNDGSSPPETDSGGSVSVSIPSKPEPTREKPKSQQVKFQNSTKKNPDSRDISRRFGEILTGSSEISSNPMRLPPGLAKSHRF